MSLAPWHVVFAPVNYRHLASKDNANANFRQCEL